MDPRRALLTGLLSNERLGRRGRIDESNFWRRELETTRDANALPMCAIARKVAACTFSTKSVNRVGHKSDARRVAS
tara:strand:+ start:201 stop:428 length:228 start_codon:yes stop_codon:yes gene_type:complete